MKDLLYYEKLLPHSYQISDTYKGTYSTLTTFLKSLCSPLESIIDSVEESYKFLSVETLSGEDLDRYGANWNVYRNGRIDEHYKIVILAYISSYLSGGTKLWFSDNLPNLLGIKGVRIFEKYPAKAVISPEGLIDLPTMQEIVKFSKPLGVDIMWGIIWLVMKEKTWLERKKLKWLYYRTGGMHNGDIILPGYKPGKYSEDNPKLKTRIGVNNGIFGFYDVNGIEPLGLQNSVNWYDNGIFVDMTKS